MAWDSVDKLNATTNFPWEFVCYYERERKTKPIIESKSIVFDVKNIHDWIQNAIFSTAGALVVVTV